MQKESLSIFIDESGDFGPYDFHSPNYYATMVFHDQSIDISQEIKKLDNYLFQKGFPFHAIHAGPLIRIVYYDYGQAELTKIITSVFNALFSNVEFRRVQPADYKLFQVADLICTMELTNDKAEHNALSKSELEFFHSARDFRKNLYKYLAKKKL